MHHSALNKTFDNITTVMISFENFENLAGGEGEENSVNGNRRDVPKALAPVEEELLENEDTDTPNAPDVQ